MAIIKLDLFQINANNSVAGQVLTSNGTGVAWSNTVTVHPNYISVGNNSVNTQIWAGNVYLNGSTLVIGNTENALQFSDGGIVVGDVYVLSDGLYVSNSTANAVVTVTANGINVGSLSIYTSGIYLGNSVLTGTHVNVGIVSINTTSIAAGNTKISNTGINVGTVSINTSALFIGNTYVTASSLFIGNTKISDGSINVGSLGITANSITVGNTTITTSQIVVGNASINSTAIQVGNKLAVLSDDSGSANNAYHLNGIAANQYILTSNSYTISGNLTFQSNIIFANTSKLLANNSTGNAGQTLTSNGNGVYWSSPRLDALTDVVEGDISMNPPANGHILTYVATNDKYYVLPLNLTGQALDGGNF